MDGQENNTRAPQRYGLGINGKPKRAWGGKTVDKFNEKNALLFTIVRRKAPSFSYGDERRF